MKITKAMQGQKQEAVKVIHEWESDMAFTWHALGDLASPLKKNQ